MGSVVSDRKPPIRDVQRETSWTAGTPPSRLGPRDVAAGRCVCRVTPRRGQPGGTKLESAPERRSLLLPEVPIPRSASPRGRRSCHACRRQPGRQFGSRQSVRPQPVHARVESNPAHRGWSPPARTLAWRPVKSQTGRISGSDSGSGSWHHRPTSGPAPSPYTISCFMNTRVRHPSPPFGWRTKKGPPGWPVSTSILLRRSEAGHGSPTAGNPPSPPPPIRTASRRFRSEAADPRRPVRRRGRPGRPRPGRAAARPDAPQGAALESAPERTVAARRFRFRVAARPAVVARRPMGAAPSAPSRCGKRGQQVQRWLERRGRRAVRPPKTDPSPARSSRTSTGSAARRRCRITAGARAHK